MCLILTNSEVWFNWNTVAHALSLSDEYYKQEADRLASAY